MNFLKEVEKHIDYRRKFNLERYGKEYIPYNPELVEYESGESTGYSDKIRRITSSSFMSVEYCESDEAGKKYDLATYTPCRRPILKKCFAFLGTNEDNELHRHDYFEMIYVYKGKRTTIIENQEVILHENELCIFDMQCAHLDIRTKSEGIAVYYCFTRQQIDNFFLSHIKDKNIKNFFLLKGSNNSNVRYVKSFIDPGEWENIEENFSKIYDELESEDIGNSKVIQVYLLRILDGIKARQETGVYIQSKKLRGTKLYNAVSKYISSNIGDISLEKLCQEFHYQADYYNRLIKKNTGLTYSEYLKQLRFEKAKNLLVNTDMSVQDILIYLGYQCHSYFYKSFQEETGFTPMEYRNKYQEKS